MARVRMSYFAEERMRNNNPNFFNTMKMQDLENKVPRIVKDIKNDLIEDIDLIYFRNNNVLSALLNVSYRNWSMNETIKNGMMHYMNTALMNRMEVPGNSIWDEKVNTANCISLATNKALLWRVCYETFVTISRYEEVDIRQSLQVIMSIDKKLFYDM